MELDIKDWISISSIVASVVIAICTALLFKTRHSIINKFSKELEAHKAKLATDIARNNTTLEERIKVMKDVLRSMAGINKKINRLQSYNLYECNFSVNFDNDDCASHKCDKDCIVHVWNHIEELNKECRDFEEYFYGIKPLLSYSAELVLQSYISIVVEIVNKAIQVGTNPKGSHKDRMLSSISVFAEIELMDLIENYDSIVFMYRMMLDVPIQEFPTNQMKTLLDKNVSLLESIRKQ